MERRQRLLCGAGIGGVLFLVGLLGILAGSFDLAFLIEGAGGTVSREGAESMAATGSLTLWGGLAILGVGVLLFLGCVTLTRRGGGTSAGA